MQAVEPSYIEPEDRWQAVADRDPAAEGHFVYAVATTGIYCRPTCPSRRPRRGNVSFFATPEAAERSGFRACKRCRPKELTAAQRVVAQVQEILHSAETPPTLGELAELTGMSPFHLQRTFKRATGLSPKQYAIAWRDTRVQEGLRDGKSVTEAMYDAGFESSHAFYASARRKLGMTPRAYAQGGRGERIRYGLFGCGLGTMLIAASEHGLVTVAFGEAVDLVAGLERELPSAVLEEDPAAVERHRREIDAFLANHDHALELPIDARGTEFQRKVWEALRRIPRGETRSYGEVAQMIDRPDASRAVARACATNPVALVIPCHRVVLASGKAGGYRWGAEIKRRLLEHERGEIRSL